MKATFTKDEVKRLLDVLNWVNTATQDTKESREQIRDIMTKLRIMLKSSPEKDEVSVEIN